MPFGKSFNESERTVGSAIVQNFSQIRIKDRANMISVSLSWNFSFGKNQNRATPQFDNGDADSGLKKNNMRAFKFIKQLDSMQCGLACMAMICYHWGQEYSVKFLNKFCTASKDGVSFKGLSDLSDTLGLHCISGKVSIQELRECPLPAILHWNQNHFIVLYKIKNNKFYIADPSKGKLVLNETEFSQHFISLTSDNKEKGLAMFFEPTEKFGIIKDDTINNERNFKFLSKYIFKHKLYFIQIIVGMIFACCMQLLFPFLTQSIVDTGIHTKNIGLIWLILIGELTIVIGRTITDVIRNWLLLHISMRINISIVSDFFIKLLKLPMSFFDTKLMGDIFQKN